MHLSIAAEYFVSVVKEQSQRSTAVISAKFSATVPVPKKIEQVSIPGHSSDKK